MQEVQVLAVLKQYVGNTFAIEISFLNTLTSVLFVCYSVYLMF